MELINNFSKDFTLIHYDPFHDYNHIWWTYKSVIKSTHTLLKNSLLRWNWEFHNHSSHGSFSSQPILQMFVEKSDRSWDLHLHPTIEKLAQGKLLINYESHCHHAQCWFDVSHCESCSTLAAWHISNWITNFEESISGAEHSKRFFINFHHNNFSLMWKFSFLLGENSSLWKNNIICVEATKLLG